MGFALIALSSLFVALVSSVAIPPLVQQVEIVNGDFEGLTCLNFTDCPGISDGCQFLVTDNDTLCNSPNPFTGASPCSIRASLCTDGAWPWERVAETDDSGIIQVFNGTHEDADLTQAQNQNDDFPHDNDAVMGYLHHSGLHQLLNGTIDSRTNYKFNMEFCTSNASTVGDLTFRVYPAATDNSTTYVSDLPDVESDTLCDNADRAIGCFADLGEARTITLHIDTSATAPNATCGKLSLLVRHYELFGHVGVNTFAVEALFEGTSGAVFVDNFVVVPTVLPDFVTPNFTCTPVFINEIDYDVINDDTEGASVSTNAIEIAGPVGFDLLGWQIFLVDGETNKTYIAGHITHHLLIPEGFDNDDIGHVTFTFADGVMNAENNHADGILIIDENGDVVQFLCYGNTTTQVGPAITTVNFNGEETPLVLTGPHAVCEHILDITNDTLVDFAPPRELTLSLRGCGECYEDFDWRVATDTTHGADGDIGQPDLGLPGDMQNNAQFNKTAVNMTGGARNQQQHFCVDHDLDGYWNGDTNLAPDGAGTNRAANPANTQCCGGNDCQPEYGHIHPNAEEICDGFDSNCDGFRPHTGARSELDLDGDGRIVCDGDCEDTDIDVFGTAAHVADNRFFININDTRDILRNGAQCAAPPVDTVAEFTDCFTPLPELVINFAEQNETCDGKDNNCNVFRDEGLGEFIEHYPDLDNDGFGDAHVDLAETNFVFLANCTFPPNTRINRTYPIGWAPNILDCDDQNPDANPSESDDTCNGVDNDCDGCIDEDLLDFDGDGFPAANCSLATCAPGNHTIDCNDNSTEAFPGNTDHPDTVNDCDGLDNDCNGLFDNLNVTDADGDTFPLVSCPTSSNTTGNNTQDCDDTRDFIHPGAPEVCDGFDDDCVDGVPDDELDGDGDGFVECGDSSTVVFCDTQPLDTCHGGDCNDGDNFTFPGAPDPCESPCGIISPIEDPTQVTCSSDCPTHTPQLGTDNNCNGQIDEDNAGDQDGDGFFLLCLSSDVPELRGEGNTTDGVSRNGCGDCDDSTDDRFPGNAEICDGLDNDCSQPFGDNAIPADETDNDHDTFRICDGDCDDNNDNRFPGNPEVCFDHTDNDCDGHVDNPFDNAAVFDRDGDGFPTQRCPTADNDTLSFQPVDCNDNDEDVFPGATEVARPIFACDGKQNDCDLISAGNPNIPASETDGDGDGYFPCQGDCDDGDATIHPNAVDTCDGVDNDCDGETDEDFVDNDGDGSPASQCVGADGPAGNTADCNDNDASVSPLLDEFNFRGDDGFGDFKDNDCDGVADDGLPRLVGDIDVAIEEQRKRSHHSSSSSDSSSSSSSSSAQPVTVAVTIRLRNVGRTVVNGGVDHSTAKDIVVDGAIALPRGAKIVTGVAEITGLRIDADGDFRWTPDNIDADDDDSVTIEIELADKRDIRNLRVVASITSMFEFNPHVVFSSI